jgi:hypothetical protein
MKVIENSMQGFNHGMPERPFIYVILKAVRSYSNKTMIDLPKYHLSCSLDRFPNFHEFFNHLPRLFYFFEILTNARKYHILNLTTKFQISFLRIFEQVKKTSSISFFFKAILMHGNIVYWVCSPDPTTKIQISFLRIFTNLLANYIFFSRPLPTKAQPMPTPMVTMVNKMGTA